MAMRNGSPLVALLVGAWFLSSSLSFVGTPATQRSDVIGSQRGQRVAMQVRKKTLPVVMEKVVTATKRLPLWKFSDEMYLNRHLAPDPTQPWMEIRRVQGRMKDMVQEQQKQDMKEMEREIAGVRLPPTWPLGELRSGMWVEGRVSRICENGVLVDIGAYTERGEWLDAFMHRHQLRQDGRYVAKNTIMDNVYLGERVRVRIRRCYPAKNTLDCSLREIEDLPDTFLGEPRPYTYHDLWKGMKVVGVVRRVWASWAIVDIGCDRLARVHVSQFPRKLDEYGFPVLGQFHHYAWTAFAVGAQMDFYVRFLHEQPGGVIELTCNQPRIKFKNEEADGGPREAVPLDPRKRERMTKDQEKDRDRAQKEKEQWEPYHPWVDEWLEESQEENLEFDSWVAQTEMDLFKDENNDFDLAVEDDDDDDLFNEDEMAPFASMDQRLLPEKGKQTQTEDMADDEFAEDDFEADDFVAADMDMGNKAFEGWELDNPATEAAGGSKRAGAPKFLDQENVNDLLFREEPRRKRGGRR